MTKKQRKVLAAKQREAARQCRKNLREWIYGPDGYPPHERRQTMSDFNKSDVQPLLRIASLFLAGKYEEAGKVAWKMDTAPREHIIDEIWELISN